MPAKFTRTRVTDYGRIKAKHIEAGDRLTFLGEVLSAKRNRTDGIVFKIELNGPGRTVATLIVPKNVQMQVSRSTEITN